MTQLSDRINALDDRRRQVLAKLVSSEPARASNERQRLCAYFVPAAESAPDQPELNDWLRVRLPAYMVPDTIMPLDAVPRLSNGKPDLAALPEARQPESESHSIVAPRNETEQTLADIWSELLGLELVSVHDDFFEVGGDSIVSIQIMSRARQAGILLQPADFAANHTIAEQAKVATQIQDVDRVLSETESSQPDRKFVFRLDGLGNTIQYYEINLDGDEPTLGEAGNVRFDKEYKRQTTLEEMASDYLARVRELQPEGPYMFVSMKCAVHVTYEVAQQLLNEGQEVSFFGVVESDAPVQSRSVATKYIRKGFRYLRRLNFKGLLAGLRLTAKRGLAVQARTTKAGEVLPFNHGLTINSYLPAHFSRKITIFQSTDYHQNHRGKENIRLWSLLAAAGVEVVIIDGKYPLDLVAKEHSHHVTSRLMATP